MNIRIFESKPELGRAAAEHAASGIRLAIWDHGKARIIVATGASQFEFLDALTSTPDIDWKKVELFHLDEYLDLPISHPASFRKYILDRLIYKTGIPSYHFLDGEQDPEEVIRTVGQALTSAPIDVAFVGIGENGHLAFNDPPADFQTEEPFLIVDLDEACRRQQLGEGWFADLADVPRRAMSMSVRQIMKAKEIIAVVPDARKAKAVKASCESEISPLTPASILRQHPNVTLYLDRESSALLNPETKAAI